MREELTNVRTRAICFFSWRVAFVIAWSPTSWSLWKICPAKYRIKHVEKWRYREDERDLEFAKLAVPGLVVDKLLQFWLHRREFDDIQWPQQNLPMVWSLVESEVQPRWLSDKEREDILGETKQGLITALEMVRQIKLESYSLTTQVSLYTRINESFGIVGSADLLLVDKETNEGTLIDFKNSHSRNRITKDQLVIYQLGLEATKGIQIKRGGYLLFNPRLRQWKWFNLYGGFKRQLLSRLADATKQVLAGEFPFKWNYFSCFRFCDVRFSCDIYKMARRQNVNFNQANNKVQV